MNKLLLATATATAGLLATAACTGTAAAHATAETAGGVITSMAYAQSMDASRSCKHAPAQAECAPSWTIDYRDTAGTHSVTVTEAVYDGCLGGFPGGRYPDCKSR